MPETIFHNSFHGGWSPSEDEFNGRKNILLQMENVDLSINGALTLAGGCLVDKSGFTGNGHTLFSRVINGTRHDYTATADGKIYRDFVAIAGTGDATNAAFGTAFNFVLAASGVVRIKDDGVAAVPVTLGVGAPTVVMALSSQATPKTPNVLLLANTVDVVGTSAVVSSTREVTLTTEADGTGAAVVQSYNMAGAPVNWNLFDDGGAATPTDALFIRLQNFDPVNDIFRIDFLLEAGNVTGDPVKNIFSFFPPTERFVFDDPTLASFVTLSLSRKDFNRIGSGNQSWGTVYGFRIVFTSPVGGKTIIITGGSTDNYFYFVGGSNAQLGTYQYAQMNVNNTGSYLAKSVLGPISLPVFANSTLSTLTYQVPADPQVNEVWIFRRSFNGDGLLDQWYRVAKVLPAFGGTVQDKSGDIAALTLDIKVNLNLITTASTGVTDKIFDIIGPIEGRWLFFTTNFMYPSDINNPDLVDASIAVRTTGAAGELFLWARAISDSVILVGTSVDIYILTGTFSTLPDNTVDIYYRPLGVKFPPITSDAAVYNSVVYYLSQDGWRSISLGGGNPSLVAPNLDRLYTNHTIVTRLGTTYNPAPLRAASIGLFRFPIAIGNNKMYCFVSGSGGGPSRCEVWDFIRQYWRVINYNKGEVTAATATQDGWILAFYATDKIVRQLESNNGLIDGATKPVVTMVFPVLDNGTPKQRKDAYTLKLRGFTGGGGGSITIRIAKDDGSNVTLASTWATGGVNVVDTPFDISSQIGITKNFQLYLSGSVQDFRLEDISIEIDTRPVQLSFLRVLPNNYGTSARKRLFGIPGQIDTLGNAVQITEVIDNVSQAPTFSVTSSYKKSFTLESTIFGGDVQIGRDFEFLLSAAAGLFEFWGFEQPRNIEIFPEPLKSYVIPVTNFGSPNKKRVRVWPFILDTLGSDVTFTPIVDGAQLISASKVFNNGKKTVFFFFKTDVFGVDYSGFFSGPSEFEIWSILAPDIVQILPIARQFDQVGPAELFKHGRIKQFEVRVLPLGPGAQSDLPYIIYMNDNSINAGIITVDNNVEKSYFIGVPKGTSGSIVRIEIGPTAYDFHRYYMRIQVLKTGRDTELEWVTLALGES